MALQFAVTDKNIRVFCGAVLALARIGKEISMEWRDSEVRSRYPGLQRQGCCGMLKLVRCAGCATQRGVARRLLSSHRGFAAPSLPLCVQVILRTLTDSQSVFSAFHFQPSAFGDA